MSAIVAKAINDSLGTKNFKGLNTIFDEQLDRFVSSMIEELPKRIEDSIKGSSVPFYMAASGVSDGKKENFINYVLLAEPLDEPNKKIGKTCVFKGTGTIAVRYSFFDDGYFYLEKNGERTKISGEGEEGAQTINISSNDSLSFYGGSGILKNLSLSMLVFQNSGIIVS